MKRGVRIAALAVLVGLAALVARAVSGSNGGPLLVTGLPWSLVAVPAAFNDASDGTLLSIGIATTAINVALVAYLGSRRG